MKPIRILHLEDNPADAELIEETLTEEGIDCNITVVDSGEEFRAALDSEAFDLVLADYSLPSFDGLRALEIVKESHPLLPFILVSGVMGEDFAVESLKAGAIDYVLKISLTRLGSAVKRAIKEAEEHGLRLAAEEKVMRLGTAIEHSSDVVIITSPDGSIEYANPAFEKITGYKVSEVLGQNPRLLKSGEHNKFFYQDLWQTITDGRTWLGIIINRKKDGTLYHDDTTISPIISKGGEITGFVGIKRDITKVIGLEKQLQQAQKMEAIGTLAGGIAHDFNNILTAILGYSEMVNDELSEGSTAKGDIRKVIGAGHRAAELVKQILTFSRQTEQELKPLKPQYVIKEALKLLRASIPTTIEIHPELDMSDGTIMADPTQIHQILMNLCTNAGHSMREYGGVLGVKLAPVEISEGDNNRNLGLSPGPYLVLEVSDTGHGMGPDVMSRIFDPFYTTKQRGDGTGLGLSVVHGIVKSYGGEIKVQSELGKGTVFRVYLPVIGEAETGEQVVVDKLARGNNERILVVDDEPDLAEMMERMLGGLGYQAVSFTDSVMALNKYREDPHGFDLVVTDMTMPNMTGAELAMEILKDRPEMPILLCTGFSEAINEESAKVIGIGAYLNKPVIKKDLGTLVGELLDNRQSG